MPDDIGCKSIMFRGGATGHVVTCGVCDWCRARRVAELEAEVEQLQAEVVWTHERLQLLQEHEDSHWTDPETGEARYLIRESDYDALVDRVTELEAALRDVANLHSTLPDVRCKEDGYTWPCRTVRLVNAALPDTTEGGES